MSQDLGIPYSGHLLEGRHQRLPLWLTFSLASSKPTPLLSDWHILLGGGGNRLTPLFTAYTHLGSNVSFQSHLPYFSSNPFVSPSYNYSLKEVQILGYASFSPLIPTTDAQIYMFKMQLKIKAITEAFQMGKYLPQLFYLQFPKYFFC